jgi:hypothetical protein
MAKVLGLRQILQKRHKLLEGLGEAFVRSFGQLVEGFVMIVWGQSGNGKSELVMQVVKELMRYGKVLYVGLEEGFESSMQLRIVRNLTLDEHGGGIEFADHNMTYEALMVKLRKKKSPKFVIIDSVQYWKITYEQYQALKEAFPNKGFVFISHAKGKNPSGTTADKIRYDAGVKVRVEGFVGFVVSRYGGSKPFVAWEEGARNHFGRKYKKTIA